jgi:hypothetical protein
MGTVLTRVPGEAHRPDEPPEHPHDVAQPRVFRRQLRELDLPIEREVVRLTDADPGNVREPVDRLGRGLRCLRAGGHRARLLRPDGGERLRVHLVRLLLSCVDRIM